MKTLLLFLAAAGLAGCASYPAPDFASGASQAYVRQPAPFNYGRAGYPYGYYASPFFYPPAFPRPFAGRTHRVQRSAPVGQPPQAVNGNRLANAVRPPHGNNR